MEIKQHIELANQEAANRLKLGEPVLVDIAPAGEVIPGLVGKMVLHSGPPIEWQHMCGAQRGAIIGQVIYEGWAGSVDEAKELLDHGEVRLEPNHHHNSVGPMAGTISPSLKGLPSRFATTLACLILWTQNVHFSITPLLLTVTSGFN
jgi:hypothetical protein